MKDKIIKHNVCSIFQNFTNPVIVVEGIDYSGKTTFCNTFTQMAKDKGLLCITISEMNDYPQGRYIKEHFNELTLDEIVTRLFDLRRIVIKSLQSLRKQYDVILLDRFIHSTLIYQFPYFNKHPILPYYIPQNTYDVFILCDITYQTFKERSANLGKDKIENSIYKYAKDIIKAYRLIATMESMYRPVFVLDTN